MFDLKKNRNEQIQKVREKGLLNKNKKIDNENGGRTS